MNVRVPAGASSSGATSFTSIDPSPESVASICPASSSNLMGADFNGRTTGRQSAGGCGRLSLDRNGYRSHAHLSGALELAQKMRQHQKEPEVGSKDRKAMDTSKI